MASFMVMYRGEETAKPHALFVARENFRHIGKKSSAITTDYFHIVLDFHKCHYR